MENLADLMYNHSFKQIEKLFGSDSSTKKWFSSQFRKVVHSMAQNVAERSQTYSEELDSMLRMHMLTSLSGSAGPDPQVLQTCLSSIRLTEDQLNQTFYRKMAECRRTTGSSLSSAGSADLSHIRALRNCHQPLVDELCVVDTGLQERLVSVGLLTPSDALCLHRQSSASAQNEKFLEILSRRMDKRTFHDVFLPELRKDVGNKQLAGQLEHALAQVKEEPQDAPCPFCTLTDEVDPKMLARSLFTKNAISSNTHKDLRDGSMSREKKWYLLRKNLLDKQKLLEALKETEPNMYRLIQKRPLPLDYCCCNYLENERFREAEANEKMRASAISFSSDSLHITFLSEYPTASSSRRICFIFDNLSHRRPCYKHDAGMLYSTFEQFDFEVRVRTEVTHEEMYRVLETFAKCEGSGEITRQQGHEIIECLVVILLVHVKDRDHILDIDHKPCRLDRLTRLLTASACPGLAGKPKIFLLPASLGWKDMSGFPEFQPLSSEVNPRVQGAHVNWLAPPTASRGILKGGTPLSETSPSEETNVLPKSAPALERSLSRISKEWNEEDSKTQISDSVVKDPYCSPARDQQPLVAAAATHTSNRPDTRLPSPDDSIPDTTSLPVAESSSPSSSSHTARPAAPPRRDANGLLHPPDDGPVKLRRARALDDGLPQAAVKDGCASLRAAAEGGPQMQAAALSRVPDEADFLLAFATCPGYVMWTDLANGSRYVNVLAHVLQMHSHARDLVTCLTLVGEEVAKMEMSPKGERSFKQMPCFVSTLRKPVYLREVRNSVCSGLI